MKAEDLRSIYKLLIVRKEHINLTLVLSQIRPNTMPHLLHLPPTPTLTFPHPTPNLSFIGIGSRLRTSINGPHGSLFSISSVESRATSPRLHTTCDLFGRFVSCQQWHANSAPVVAVTSWIVQRKILVCGLRRWVCLYECFPAVPYIL